MLRNRNNRFVGTRGSYAVVLGLALITVPPSVSAADFETGMEAFRAGETRQAFDAWHPLARTGHPDAQHALGHMYEYGHGTERDDAEAAFWYEKAAAQNNAEAQYRLGVLLDNGWGVPRNRADPAAWYARAAQLGHVFAQHDLAFMYLKGTGVPMDRVQAYKWLKIASQSRADLMAKHLDHVSKAMAPAEVREAERQARAWLNAQRL